LGSLFQVATTAAPGCSLEELERAIADEIARLASDDPLEDELDRGRAQAEASFVYRLQTLGGFGGKADQLNAYNVYCGTPDYFEHDLGRYVAVTADDLKTAARQLDPAAATALSVVPHGQGARALKGSRPAFE